MSKSKLPQGLRPRKWTWYLRRSVFRVVYAVPAFISYVFGVRYVWMAVPTRIGHLALELDCYVKDSKLRGAKGRSVLLVSRRKIPNAALADYWRDYFIVIENRGLVKLCAPFGFFPFVSHQTAKYAVAFNETCESYAVNARWGERPPLLSLKEIHRERGRAVLARLGVSPDAWFVCVHSRESGYVAPRERWHNERGQDYRNSDIGDYRLAMAAVTARGGWCIRVGDPSMKPLAPMERVLDYALSPEKADWMDIFLCASCRFFLGNSSGLAIVAGVFGVPCALANQAPPAVTYSHFSQDIAIPKRIRRGAGDFMSFPESFNAAFANYRYTELMEKDDLSFIDNTPEEIRDLAIEMLDRLDGIAVYTEEDERRQAQFRAFLRPGHYSYGAASRIGRDFLRAHAKLID